MNNGLYDKHHQFVQLLRELISKKQVELLGGGYYNPVLPLLFPVDRTGQIEQLTAKIRRTTGKKPHGMSLFRSVWDNSLVSCIKNCGMDYVVLDSSLLPFNEKFFLPYVASEQGKIIKVLPVHRKLAPPVLKEVSPESFLSSLLKTVEKSVKNDSYKNLANQRVICLNLDVAHLEYLITSGWINHFFEMLQTTFTKSVKITLPAEYLHNEKNYVPSYITAGMREDIAKWASVTYTPVENKNTQFLTVHNFLNTYKRCKAVYNRMLYVSSLILQCHGDKARKNAARESLWKAQNGESFVCSPDGIFANNAIRQTAYRYLTEAEKYIRDAADFKENVSSFDYNYDGHDEYVCSMDKYTACISPVAGCINELNILHNTGNYADNLTRFEKFDKVTDNYERGLFVDHLFSKEEFSEYKKGLPTGCGIFSQVLFDEVEFSGQKKEIKLKGEGTFSNLALPVSLRKNYIARSNGFTIQYILKNEGPIALKGTLVVESNFAQTDFTATDINSYKVEVISNDESVEFASAKTKPASAKNVSFIQITDTANDISFVYEPNEDASVCCMPLFFKRPVVTSATPKVAGTTFVASLVWEVDLAAGMEMEKNINFAIITPKKRSSNKKRIEVTSKTEI